jgi:RNA polymerase sigma-70 factor (ECF subfamily)
MEITNTYERTRSQKMNVDAYFDSIYNDTRTEVLEFIVIKSSNADQVDDIFQNVYQSFYVRISRKGFGDIQNPCAFLIELAKKELAHHFKRGTLKREMETDLEGYDEAVDADEVSFVDLMEHKNALNRAQEIVRKMPLLSYKTFILYYFYDMSVSSISEQLELSEDSVKSRLWRARNMVRKGIKGEI